jgi:hypothetical protein
MVSWIHGSSRGEVTINQLQLNRLDLCDERLQHLCQGRELLARIDASEGAVKRALVHTLRLMVNEGPYTAALMSMLAQLGYEDLVNDSSPPAEA